MKHTSRFLPGLDWMSYDFSCATSAKNTCFFYLFVQSKKLEPLEILQWWKKSRCDDHQNLRAHWIICWERKGEKTPSTNGGEMEKIGEWRNWKKVKVGERSFNFSLENYLACWCWGLEIIRCCNSASPRIPWADYRTTSLLLAHHSTHTRCSPLPNLSTQCCLFPSFYAYKNPWGSFGKKVSLSLFAFIVCRYTNAIII